MSPWTVISLIWSFSAVALVGGLALGRGWGRQQALRAAAAEAGDEACRAVLAGRDLEAGRLFELSQRLRQLAGRSAEG